VAKQAGVWLRPHLIWFLTIPSALHGAPVVRLFHSTAATPRQQSNQFFPLTFGGRLLDEIRKLNV
jgi:hypothetical protein